MNVPKAANASLALKLVFFSSIEHKMYRTKVIQIDEVFSDLQYCLNYKNAHYVYETCSKYNQENTNVDEIFNNKKNYVLLRNQKQLHI